MSEQKAELLPIGTRVTHWHGGADTHGKGTIVAYNFVEPSEYLKTNFKDAVEIASKGQVVDGLIRSFYDKDRYPYLVHFDPSAAYPKGYRDVYGPDSIQPLENGLNIFPNDWTRVVGRRWDDHFKTWTPWLEFPEDAYHEYVAAGNDVKEKWEFCVRPLPKPKYRFSPASGAYVPLSKPDGVECYPEGYHPPLNCFVEFTTYPDYARKRGMVAQLGSMGPMSKCETVFVTVEPLDQRVYFVSQVAAWRELIDLNDFTPALRKYLATVPEEMKA